MYETAPWGGVEQDDYLNAVVVVDDAGTDAYGWLAPGARAGGGRRPDPGGPLGPAHPGRRRHRRGRRHVSADPELTLPHPRAHERAFVLVPWADVDPDAVLPGHGRVADLAGGPPIRQCPSDGPGAAVIGPTRIRDLVGYAAAVTLITWLALRQWYGELPAAELVRPAVAWCCSRSPRCSRPNQLRDRIRRRPGAAPVQPLVAARMLALAKASAVVGAVMAGVWAGLLVYVVPRLDFLAAAGGDTPTGAVGVVAAVALTAAALWLEYCCRTPTPPDSDRTS